MSKVHKRSMSTIYFIVIKLQIHIIYLILQILPLWSQTIIVIIIIIIVLSEKVIILILILILLIKIMIYFS